MVIVMTVIFLILAFGATVLTGAMQGEQSSTTNRNSSQALAAAQAGLDVALYRLNRMSNVTSDVQCLAGSLGVTQLALAVGGWCGPVDSAAGAGPALANGTTYKYWETNVLATGSKCGLVAAIMNGTTHQRCIVAVGTSGGVTRRIVQLVKGTSRTTSVVNGILSYGAFTTSGGLTLTGDIGSNGNVAMSGSGINVHGAVQYVPPHTFTQPNGCTSCGQGTPKGAPFAPSVPDPTAFALSQVGNKNASLGLGSAYNAATRELGGSNVGSSGSPIVFTSGVYNFCNVDLSGQTYLKVPAGETVTIYIDSPFRPASGCAAGKGNFKLPNQMSWINENSDPGSLQIIAYGNPAGIGGLPAFQMSSGSNGANDPFAAIVNAPASNFTTAGPLAMAGQITAGSVTLNNPVTLNAAGGTAPLTNQVAWGRDRSQGGWAECKANTVPSTPDDGCQA